MPTLFGRIKDSAAPSISPENLQVQSIFFVNRENCTPLFFWAAFSKKVVLGRFFF